MSAVNLTFNINTPDVASFRRSQAQVAARLTSQLQRSRRREFSLMPEPAVPGLDGMIQAVIRDPELFAKSPPPFDWGRVWKMVRKVLAGESDWK